MNNQSNIEMNDLSNIKNNQSNIEMNNLSNNKTKYSICSNSCQETIINNNINNNCFEKINYQFDLCLNKCIAQKSNHKYNHLLLLSRR